MAVGDLEIILCDQNLELCRAWKKAFRGLDVEVAHGDFFDIEADAYVSPANSYGYMDGGFDLLLRDRFPGIQERVQREIGRLGGMLPVGDAIVVETGDGFVPYLVCAPTMEVPSVVMYTSNAYKAMRAVLLAIAEFNDSNDDGIASVAVPGLCTGIGQMAPEDAAEQMSRALREL